MHFDPVSGLLLPDGVELATVGRRIGAFFLAIPLSIITLGLGYVVWGLIVWGRGQTPALQVLGMRCWRPEEGRVAGWWWMALREIVGSIAEGILSLISQLVSFILMLTSKDRKCLHDIIAELSCSAIRQGPRQVKVGVGGCPGTIEARSRRPGPAWRWLAAAFPG